MTGPPAVCGRLRHTGAAGGRLRLRTGAAGSSSDFGPERHGLTPVSARDRPVHDRRREPGCTAGRLENTLLRPPGVSYVDAPLSQVMKCNFYSGGATTATQQPSACVRPSPPGWRTASTSRATRSGRSTCSGTTSSSWASGSPPSRTAGLAGQLRDAAYQGGSSTGRRTRHGQRVPGSSGILWLRYDQPTGRIELSAKPAGLGSRARRAPEPGRRSVFYAARTVREAATADPLPSDFRDALDRTHSVLGGALTCHKSGRLDERGGQHRQDGTGPRLLAWRLTRTLMARWRAEQKIPARPAVRPRPLSLGRGRPCSPRIPTSRPRQWLTTR